MSRAWTLALALHASLATAAGVEVVKTHPGFSGPNPSTAGTSSADMMGGVSPRHLVGFINGAFEVRRKSDGGLVQPPLTQREFWTAAFRNVGRTMEGNPYDPRIFWDPMTKRWFASSNSMDLEAGPSGSRMSSRIFFAVSQDDDPTHPWKAVMHICPMAVDNAKLGLDRNGVYSTALTGGPGDTRAMVPIIAIPKADLLWKGDGAPSLEHVNTFTVDGGTRLSDRKYAGVEGMVPAFDLDPKKKPGDPAVYVNRYRKEVDGETMLQIRRVRWTSPTKAALSEPVEIGLTQHYSVQPTSTGVQPPLPQPGLVSPGIRAGEARIVNAVVRGGSLWTVAAAQMGASTGAFWVQVDLATKTLVQHGTLSDPEGDLLFPSINVDGKGNVGIGMSRTSATEHLSIYVTGRAPSDPPHTLRPLVRAVKGIAVHYRKDMDLTKPSNASWSDYSTVVVDPSDPTLFWTYQEAATNETWPPDKADRFGTHWVAWRVGAAK